MAMDSILVNTPGSLSTDRTPDIPALHISHFMNRRQPYSKPTIEESLLLPSQRTVYSSPRSMASSRRTSCFSPRTSIISTRRTKQPYTRGFISTLKTLEPELQQL